MSDSLTVWFRQQLHEAKQIALAASRTELGDGITPTGEHWHWVETDHDQPVPPDPVTETYVGESADATGRVALRSVEEYPTDRGGPLAHHVIPYAEEVGAAAGLHITRNDPASAIAGIEADLRLLDAYEEAAAYYDANRCAPAGEVHGLWTAIRLRAEALADRPGYQEAWRP